jgi:predicted RNA binding protein YcfA (HicA-like mRNA interferase family)
MTLLPVVTGRDCIRALQRAGFVIDRQKGSHITLIRDDPRARATVPNHRKNLKPGTLRRIIRDAEMTVDEFVEWLDR